MLFAVWPTSKFWFDLLLLVLRRWQCCDVRLSACKLWPVTMLMFSRNNAGSGAKTREKSEAVQCSSPCRFSVHYNNNNNHEPSSFSRAADRRDSRASTKKSRPHSWHSTLQKGLARARSRSSGREKERDKAKRASSALNTGCPHVPCQLVSDVTPCWHLTSHKWSY